MRGSRAQPRASCWVFTSCRFPLEPTWQGLNRKRGRGRDGARAIGDVAGAFPSSPRGAGREGRLPETSLSSGRCEAAQQAPKFSTSVPASRWHGALSCCAKGGWKRTSGTQSPGCPPRGAEIGAKSDKGEAGGHPAVSGPPPPPLLRMLLSEPKVGQGELEHNRGTGGPRLAAGCPQGGGRQHPRGHPDPTDLGIGVLPALFPFFSPLGSWDGPRRVPARSHRAPGTVGHILPIPETCTRRGWGCVIKPSANCPVIPLLAFHPLAASR